MRRLSVLLLTAVVALACAPNLSTAVFLSLPPAPENAPVAVFASRLPTCAYDEVGQITASDEDSFASESSFLPAILKKARAMGGDAIVNFSRTSDKSGAVVIGNVLAATETKKQSATVIRFRDPMCRQ